MSLSARTQGWNPCVYNNNNNSAPERLDLYITPLASDSTVGASNLAQRRVYMSTAMRRARTTDGKRKRAEAHPCHTWTHNNPHARRATATPR